MLRQAYLLFLGITALMANHAWGQVATTQTEVLRKALTMRPDAQQPFTSFAANLELEAMGKLMVGSVAADNQKRLRLDFVYDGERMLAVVAGNRGWARQGSGPVKAMPSDRLDALMKQIEQVFNPAAREMGARDSAQVMQLLDKLLGQLKDLPPDPEMTDYDVVGYAGRPQLPDSLMGMPLRTGDEPLDLKLDVDLRIYLHRQTHRLGCATLLVKPDKENKDVTLTLATNAGFAESATEPLQELTFTLSFQSQGQAQVVHARIWNIRVNEALPDRLFKKPKR